MYQLLNVNYPSAAAKTFAAQKEQFNNRSFYELQMDGHRKLEETLEVLGNGIKVEAAYYGLVLNIL